MERKIPSSEFELNQMYSEPVFFEDGKNMFLSAGKTVKQYHLKAIKDWNIQYFLTSGHLITDAIEVELESLNPAEEVEELEELEELEEI
ncbi:MAG: phosphohydrolase [Treponema sp.]|nr:phosphohydrolase [Treponema sp.]